MPTERRPVEYTCPQGTSTGHADIHVWSAHAARKKGLGWGLCCWGVALAALPIPLVHFIATPLCLLLGPVIGFAVYRIHAGARDIAASTGTCPACGAAVSLRVGVESWPQAVVCTGCGAAMTARPAAP